MLSFSKVLGPTVTENKVREPVVVLSEVLRFRPIHRRAFQHGITGAVLNVPIDIRTFV